MERLVELRTTRKISQRALAQAIGCSQNMISQWENGTRDPGTETLQALANYFQVSVDYLLGRETTPTNKENKVDEIMELYDQLPDDRKKAVQDFIKFQASQN